MVSGPVNMGFGVLPLPRGSATSELCIPFPNVLETGFTDPLYAADPEMP